MRQHAVELPDHTILASAGSMLNEVFSFSKDSGYNIAPLFTLWANGIARDVRSRCAKTAKNRCECVCITPPLMGWESSLIGYCLILSARCSVTFA